MRDIFLSREKKHTVLKMIDRNIEKRVSIIFGQTDQCNEGFVSISRSSSGMMDLEIVK